MTVDVEWMTMRGLENRKNRTSVKRNTGAWKDGVNLDNHVLEMREPVQASDTERSEPRAAFGGGEDDADI